MDETLGEGIGGEGSPDDMKALLSSTITPGESVVWAGKPEPSSIARRSLPKAIFGLGFIAFTLIWMTGVVQGKNNKWDRGKAVAPFAPHNVLIAALAGLWFLPPGLYMLTWPLRGWRKARGTAYALTDRRAVVIEPQILGGHQTFHFTPEALSLMQCDEREDGSGDLIFEHRKTMVGMPEAVGFLAIERVREVEALVKQALGLAGPSVSGLPFASRAEAGSDRSLASDSAHPPRAYRLPLSSRFGLGLFSVVFCLVTLLIAVRVIAVPLVLVMGILPAGRPKAFPGEELGLVVCFAGFVFLTRRLLITPVEIAVGGDGTVTFLGRLRAQTVPIGEILSVRTGGWRDPNRFQAEVRHKGGTVYLLNKFPDFRDFLATVKDLNPTVDIRGF